MKKPFLTVVGDGAELAVYPIPLDATLGRHEWWPFYGAKMLTPAFLARCPEHLQIYAVRLWNHAMNAGDPAGTLPEAPEELAVIVGRDYGDPKFHVELRSMVLFDWTPCRCATEDGEREAVRLHHHVFTRVAVAAWTRSQKAERERPERTREQRSWRCAKQLRAIGAGAMADRPERVAAVLEHLDARSQKITQQNVRVAAERVSMELKLD